MSAQVLSGVEIAAEIKAEVAVAVGRMAEAGVVPGLTVILLGNDPASEVYVRNKVRSCGELGIRSTLLTPAEATTEAELLQIIDGLNRDEEVDGILVQLPLPKHIDVRRVLESVSPEKDVDGFHPVNVGRLQIGQPALAPCTPAGIIEVLKRRGIPIAGADCVMVGRSDIVGKPASTMLLNEGATVSVCHKGTRDLAAYTRRAEILVVAVGVPGLITPEMVKPGAVLIDVGMNRLDTLEHVERFFPGDRTRVTAFEKRGFVLMGDFDPRAYEVSSAYTPVPGGVGALTIAMLMKNTVKAAAARRGMEL